MVEHMRVRINFAKTDAMRYTSHLDLYRAWERLMRRAGLPLGYTQGFSPHPRINLACALPLGFTSEAEVVDIWLEHFYPTDEIMRALQGATPPGLDIQDVETIDDRSPTLQVVLQSAEYIMTLLETVPDLDQRLQSLLRESALPRVRRDKPYDLRPLILDAACLAPDASGKQRLFARLSAREGATGRPEELLAALQIDPLAARVHRTRLVFAESV